MNRPAIPNRPLMVKVVPAVFLVTGCASPIPPLWPFSARTTEVSQGIRTRFAGADSLFQLAETPPPDTARFRALRFHTSSTLSAVVKDSKVLAGLAAHRKALADERRLVDEATAQARRDTADFRRDTVRSLVEETTAGLKAYERVQRDLDDPDEDVFRSIRAALNALGDHARIADRNR